MIVHLPSVVESPWLVKSLTEGKGKGKREKRGENKNENRFQLSGETRVMSKALLLPFHWENLFPVMEAKGPALCLAPQSAIMDLQQGNLSGPHPQCPSVRREQWRFTLGPCVCGQCTPPLCSSPSPRTPNKLPV